MSLILLFASSPAATITANLVEAADSADISANVSMSAAGGVADAILGAIQESNDNIVINAFSDYAASINVIEASDAIVLTVAISIDATINVTEANDNSALPSANILGIIPHISLRGSVSGISIPGGIGQP